MKNESSNKPWYKSIAAMSFGAIAFLGTIIAIISDSFNIFDKLGKRQPETEVSKQKDTTTILTYTDPFDSLNTVTLKKESELKEKVENKNPTSIDSINNRSAQITPTNLPDSKQNRESSEVVITQNGPENKEIIDKDLIEDFNKISITELRKSECEIQDGATSFTYYGQACFENKTDQDLIVSVPESFSGIPDEGLQETKVLIPKGGKNCFPKMIVSLRSEIAVRNVPYTFTSVNTSFRKTGKITITLETCKTKSITLSKKNLYLE